MRQKITDAAVGITRQVFKVLADALTQAGHFQRQDDAEFGDQTAQPVVGGGAFFNKALARAV